MYQYQLFQKKRYLKHLSSGKHFNQQQDLYRIFIDFKTAFDRVWHAALWVNMTKYNISINSVRVIKNLSDKATNAVLFNSSIRDWFRKTVEVRQGYLLLLILNIFWKGS